MNFSIPTLELQMECFEGPLSVLLNLIKKNKIDIFDIPIGWITDRFLEYVEFVKEMNLRIAEDFIEVASLLIFIKSRMLLPSDEDPREELVEKIIEYEKIRAMVKSFDVFPVLGRDTFARGAAIGDEEDEGDVISLCALFFHLIKNREERFYVIRDIRPTLEERLEEVKRILEESGTYTWDISLEEALREKVATLLAMLEITKLKLAVISQRRPFGTIILKKR